MSATGLARTMRRLLGRARELRSWRLPVADRLRGSDVVEGRFWATTGGDPRALFEEFAAIQHYVRGDERNFLRELALARGFRGSEKGGPSRTSLLLDILEANQLVRDGQIEEAEKRYIHRIEREERTYRGWRSTRRGLLQQREILGLLELNLANLLGEEKEREPAEVERHYGRACALMPSSTYAHRCHADYLLSQERWEEALEKYHEAFVEGGLDERGAAVNTSLAWAHLQWARGLLRRAEREEAEGTPTAAVTDSGTTASVAEARSAALRCLDDALKSLTWDEIPAWEAALHFERASNMEAGAPTAAGEEVGRTFLRAAELYAKGDNVPGSAAAFERAGDALVRQGLLREAEAAYEDGLRQSDGAAAEQPGGKAKATSGRARSAVRNVDALLAKAGIAALGLGDHGRVALSFDRFSERWWKEGARPTGEVWGPCYDIQLLGKGLLSSDSLRHAMTIHWHSRLFDSPSLEDARDLTAALLNEYTRAANATSPGPADDTAHPGRPDVLLNVVTPLALEIGPDLERLYDLESARVQETAGFASDDIKDTNSLVNRLREAKGPVDSFLAQHLPASLREALEGYDRIVSDEHALREALATALNEILADSQLYDVERFEKDSPRPRTTALLAQRRAERDPRLMNTILLENTYRRELERSPISRWAGPVRRRIDSEYGVRIPGIRMRPSSDLGDTEYRVLVHEMEVARASTSEGLDAVFAALGEVVAGHLAEFVGHQEAQNFLERHGLVIGTVEDISEKEHCSHIDPLTAVLRALTMERVPLTEASAIYQVFRRGWKGHRPVTEIVEEVRRIPEVRSHLWGNDTLHTFVLLPEALEASLERAKRRTDGFEYLAMRTSERSDALAALERAIAGVEKPALVARREGQRPLLRQLVATRLPELPVLAAAEVPPTQSRFAELPNVAGRGAVP